MSDVTFALTPYTATPVEPTGARFNLMQMPGEPRNRWLAPEYRRLQDRSRLLQDATADLTALLAADGRLTP